MKITSKSVLSLCAALLLCLQAHAEVSVNSTRITAADVLATGEFYKAAFGMKEVNRLDLQGGAIELFLNFGSTDQQALANTGSQVVIMQRGADEVADGVAHLIFNVTDMDATVAAIKAAGGTMAREPFEYGTTGIKIGIANDPAGNLVELLQQP